VEKYQGNQFVNIVNSHKSNQLNVNSTIQTTTKVTEESYQSSDDRYTKEYNIQRQDWRSSHRNSGKTK
jgi:hypothetical protein